MIERKEAELKSFFNSIGTTAALLGGFAFTAIVELGSWPEPVTRHAWFLRHTMVAFLVVSFIAFLTPLMLNLLFLNVSIDTEDKLRGLFRVKLMYTVLMGVGLGGLQGALCLLMLVTFPPLLTYVLVGGLLLVLVLTLRIMRRFKRYAPLEAPREPAPAAPPTRAEEPPADAAPEAEASEPTA